MTEKSFLFNDETGTRHYLEQDGDAVTLHAFQDVVAVFPVGAAAVGAAPHRDHVPGFGHLVVQGLDTGGHFQCDGSGDDHHIRLPRGPPEECAEPVEVVVAGARRHHFDGAACETELHPPDRREAGPVQQSIHRGNEDVAVLKFLV